MTRAGQSESAEEIEAGDRSDNVQINIKRTERKSKADKYDKDVGQRRIWESWVGSFRNSWSGWSSGGTEVTETVLEVRNGCYLSTELHTAKTIWALHQPNQLKKQRPFPRKFQAMRVNESKTVLYSVLGVCDCRFGHLWPITGCIVVEHLVVLQLYRLHLASHLLLLNQVAVNTSSKLEEFIRCLWCLFVDKSKSGLKMINLETWKIWRNCWQIRRKQWLQYG